MMVSSYVKLTRQGGAQIVGEIWFLGVILDEISICGLSKVIALPNPVSLIQSIKGLIKENAE